MWWVVPALSLLVGRENYPDFTLVSLGEMPTAHFRILCRMPLATIGSHRVDDLLTFQKPLRTKSDFFGIE